MKDGVEVVAGGNDRQLVAAAGDRPQWWLGVAGAGQGGTKEEEGGERNKGRKSHTVGIFHLLFLLLFPPIVY